MLVETARGVKQYIPGMVQEESVQYVAQNYPAGVCECYERANEIPYLIYIVSGDITQNATFPLTLGCMALRAS